VEGGEEGGKGRGGEGEGGYTVRAHVSMRIRLYAYMYDIHL